MPGDNPADCYDALSAFHHLIFADWNASIAWQAGVLGPLLEREAGRNRLRILDCACGIGTQALGLAMRGHAVVGSDVSGAAVARARREAAARDLPMTFHVADMRDLSGIAEADFDAVLAADNALPHLPSDDDIRRAAGGIAAVLRPGGVFVASIRDYDEIVREHPPATPPVFHGAGGNRRIVHQVWDWISEREYRFHLYITWQEGDGWQYRHFVSTYRAVLRAELSALLESAGFVDVRWLMPGDSGYYQPIVVARPAATS